MGHGIGSSISARFWVTFFGTCTRGRPPGCSPSYLRSTWDDGKVIPSSRLLRAVALALLALASVTACNSSALTQGPKLAKDQTLRLLLEDQPASLDPGQTQYPYETAVLRVISETLLKPSADLSGVVPAAAQSYDVANGGTVFVFHLRPAGEYS